ncbi:MAG: nucleotidyl transferase AbiEii/AbiGii toxin family protein [Candidatus Acidiferrales bacterium]
MAGKIKRARKRHALLLDKSLAKGGAPWVVCHNLLRHEAELLAKIEPEQTFIYEYDFVHRAPKPETCPDCTQIVFEHRKTMLDIAEKEAAIRGVQILRDNFSGNEKPAEPLAAKEHFELCIDVLPPAQRRLWNDLGATPPQFVLYGGTAIALRLGHRHSKDFDFFSSEPFSPMGLRSRVPYLSDAEVIQSAKNTLTCLVNRGGPVQVSFFGGLHLNRVADPERAADVGIWVASRLDLLGLKLAVLTERAEYKDYVDIDTLLASGVDLAQGLAAALAIYGGQFNPLLSLKALTFYAEGDLHRFEPAARARLTAEAERVNPRKLPVLSARKGLVPA